ncbi:MAG: CHC2 zinc finger domain-containing protein [Xanthomonadales bacterium]|nr:CHC2 zinc finger domain-containing protein [Xanthomonadales bacterium]
MVDLVAVVRGYVPDLRKSGTEWEACCPFHDERTPSFTVSASKGFVHCFGCGAHHDVIGFVMRMTRCDFKRACEQLGARDFAPALVRAAQRERSRPDGILWVPVYPVPEDAPLIAAGIECAIWNPKRDRTWRMTPSRADAYRDARGRLMGYVLRTDIRGSKLTPQVTWCIGPDGAMRWCVRTFGTPRPLCGLDDLARKPMAPVLVVEGEKCRAAGAAALPQYAVVTWPGGGKGLRYVDWSPLDGREVVLWPDADVPGRQAMLGYQHYDGRWIDGAAQIVHAAGAGSIRYVDTASMPKGWDIADALDGDGWTPRQLAVWAGLRVQDVEVVSGAMAA